MPSLPFLRVCLQAGMLLEDGLGLWLVTLRNAPSPLPPSLLHSLFPHLARLLMRSTEHMHVGMALLTSCLLAGGPVRALLMWSARHRHLGIWHC